MRLLNKTSLIFSIFLCVACFIKPISCYGQINFKDLSKNEEEKRIKEKKEEELLKTFKLPKEDYAPDSFKALSDLAKKKYYIATLKAGQEFRKKQIFNAFLFSQAALAINNEHFPALNNLGIYYLKVKDYDIAIAHYEKLAKKFPMVLALIHNEAESHYAKQNYKIAYEKFLKYLIKFDKKINKISKDLVKFKLMICQYQLGNYDKGDEHAKGLSIYDDSPFYYFAKAVREFHKKKLIESDKWLKTAQFIYSDTPLIINNFVDAMLEAGYLKNYTNWDKLTIDGQLKSKTK